MNQDAGRILKELAQLDRHHAAEQRDLTARHREERGEMIARLLLIQDATAFPLSAVDLSPTALMTPKQAQYEFRLSGSVLFRLGTAHPLTSIGGFCIEDERGRRQYLRAPLARHLQLHPVRRQSSKS